MSPSFAQLGVPESICRALDKRGITSPFEIQAATIADALAGRDVCGRAPTGSGKTLAFGIPLVATVEKGTSRRPRALVLAPTRELADQIHAELRSFAGSIRTTVVYGGVGYGPQLKALRQGVDILVACPGRLEDLLSQGSVNLADVEHVVIDEADRMADMGFLPAVRRLVDQTSPNRQTVLFSATLDGDIAKLTRDYQRDPVRHEVGEETPDVTTAHHVFWKTSQNERTEATAEAVNAVWPAIVFCRTRHGADRLAKRLSRQGIATAAIHGGRSQSQRTRALRDFADNRVHALIATDVAARGIHVDGVASVIHYDPPEDHKAYIHRSGRTARAGQGGVVLSLIQPNQHKEARRVQRQVGVDATFDEIDAAALRELSSEAAPELKPAPAQPGQGSRNGQRKHGSGQARSRNRSRRGNGGGQNRKRNGSGNNGAKNRKRNGGGGNSRRNESDSNGGGQNHKRNGGAPGRPSRSSNHSKNSNRNNSHRSSRTRANSR